MKRFLLIPILMVFAGLTLQAQDKNDGAINEKFFEAKIREFVYRLELTDAQKAEFVPVYKKYSEEKKAAVAAFGKPGRPETKEAAADAVKTKIQRQQKMLDVRLKYVDAFAKILEPWQMTRLFEIENQIQSKLNSRQGHPGQGGPQGGQQGGRTGGRPGQGRSGQGHH